jgi:hypothetical protein
MGASLNGKVKVRNAEITARRQNVVCCRSKALNYPDYWPIRPEFAPVHVMNGHFPSGHTARQALAKLG